MPPDAHPTPESLAKPAFDRADKADKELAQAAQERQAAASEIIKESNVGVVVNFKDESELEMINSSFYGSLHSKVREMAKEHKRRHKREQEKLEANILITNAPISSSFKM